MSTNFYLPSYYPKDGAFLLGHGVLGDSGSRKYFTNVLLDASQTKGWKLW